MTDDLRPLLKLNLETIQKLDDETLAALGAQATNDLVTLRTVSNTLDGELLRRIAEKGPEATRLKTDTVLAVRSSVGTYEWNAAKAMDVLRPVVTPAEFKKAFKEKPPEPPKTVVTVMTQSALALAKAAGLDDEIATAYKRKEGPPSVKYTLLDGAPADPDEEPFE